jgi:DAACS family dicarboxylate/amino acid:cation (Na+ or H+) symporter
MAYEDEVQDDVRALTKGPRKRVPLHTRILIGLCVGVVAGLIVNGVWGGGNPHVEAFVAHVTEPVGALFLRGLLMIVVPLVGASLVLGVVAIGDVRRLGRVGLKAFGYTLVISSLSVVIGLGLANTIRPGERVAKETADRLQQRYAGDASKRMAAYEKESAAQDTPLMSVIKTIVPANPLQAASTDPPQMLQIMFFALLVGVALTLLPEDKQAPLVKVLESIYGVAANVVDLLMAFAPYAVACLLFNNVARFGLDLLAALSWFVLTVLLGLGLHMFGVYSISVWMLSRIPPLEFFRRVKTAMLTAFSTSSSNATLPTAMRVSEENLGVPRDINAFVLTIGATANQNGTALYEGVTVLFLAQLAQAHLSLGQQLMVVYLAILGSIGTAGVPAGSIPFIIAVLATIGVNPALIAIVLGVDRILDMCRTTVNVIGDLTVATYVARSEGYELLRPPLSSSSAQRS